MEPTAAPSAAPVRAIELLRIAERTYRREVGRVVLPALVVFAIAAAADTLAIELATHQQRFWPFGALIVAASALSSLGLTFYAGLLDRLVGAVERDQPAPAVLDVLRTLPYGPLIMADLVLLALTAVSTAALIIPGVVLFTLFAIVGPLINLEGHGVVSAFRHSARLVWPHFWVALVLVTIPILAEHEVVDLIEVVVPKEAVWVVFTSHAVVGVLFGTVVGLLEVSLAERLVNPPIDLGI